MTIAELKEKKSECGLSNREISELSGVPLGTVNKLFSGRTAAPRYKTLQAIAQALARVQASPDLPLQGSVRYSHVFPDSASPRSVRYDRPSSADQAASAVAESARAYLTKEKKQGEYTIEDYYAFPEDKRCELIDGVIYDMGSPSAIHQYIVRAIFDRLHHFIRSRNGACETFFAPFDVQPDREDDKTIVQPDVFVVCDRSKIAPSRIIGAPDLVIEVLSPSTRKKDIGVKANVYERSGVREYWLVDPGRKNVIVFRYENEYTIHLYGVDAKIPVGILGNVPEIDLAEITQEYDFLLSEH